MKKKILGLVLVAAMVMGMATTAMAANSPSTKPGADVKGAKDANGNAITVTQEATSQPAPSTAAIKEILGADFKDGMTVVSIMDLKVIGNAVAPYTITIGVEGATSKTNGSLLHYNGSAWEKVDTTWGKGTATGTFQSLSPVAVVMEKDATASSDSVSPKTAENTALPMMAAFVAVAALGCAVVVKKRNA